MTEQWRPVARAGGRYEVSNMGRVRSVPLVRGGGRILSPTPTPQGRLQFGAHMGGGKRLYLMVHREVCRAFHGEPTVERNLARHLDGNHLNNHASNLAWGTPAENTADAVRHGAHPMGERHGMAKISASQAREIRELFAAGGWTKAELGRRFGISRKTVFDILRSKIWKVAA